MTQPAPTTRSSTLYDSTHGLRVDEPSSSLYDSHHCLNGACGHLGGWAAMAQTVRDFDEEKLKECKEDVDTLLVFAGLFSAVLTAFLLDSYQSLQEDTSTLILQVLLQIADQTSSYTLHSGMLNATATHNTAPPPFQPPRHAVLINIVWFASLVFSLVTASFGMLVKQWLREYLAVQYPSPQARLRVRHHRYPELKNWNVFDIAAMLPLLLQLALGLFFLGLCYFTASVNINVGRTIIPLVSGWAFCFFMTILLPVFFPRCPYKTFFLKNILRILHVHLPRRWRFVRDALRQLYNTALANMLPWAIITWTHSLEPNSTGVNVHLDEAKVAQNESLDLDIIAAVDALQSNDELLGTTILESLRQVQPRWTDLVKFVLRILEHRLQVDHLVDTKPMPLDLTPLTRRGRTAIVDIVSVHWEMELQEQLHYERGASRWQESDATMSAFFILIAPARYPLPSTGAAILKDYLLNKGGNLCAALAKRCSGVDDQEDQLPILLRGFIGLLKVLGPDLDQAVQWFEALFGGRFSAIFPDTPYTHYKIEGVAYWPWAQTISHAGLREAAGYLICILSTTLRKIQSGQLDPLTPSSIHAALRAMFHDIYLLQEPLVLFAISRRDSGDFRAIIHESFAERNVMPLVLEVIMELPAAVLLDLKIQWGFRIMVGFANRDGDDTSSVELENLRGYVILAETSESKSPLTLPQLIRLCYVAVQMLGGQEISGKTTHTVEFKQLFSALARTCNALYDFRGPPAGSPDDKALVRSCLRAIQRLELATLEFDAYEDNEAGYRTWLESFRLQDTIFEDDFIDILVKVYGDVENLRQFYRVRRLYELRTVKNTPEQ